MRKSRFIALLRTWSKGAWDSSCWRILSRFVFLKTFLDACYCCEVFFLQVRISFSCIAVCAYLHPQNARLTTTDWSPASAADEVAMFKPTEGPSTSRCPGQKLSQHGQVWTSDSWGLAQCGIGHHGTDIRGCAVITLPIRAVGANCDCGLKGRRHHLVHYSHQTDQHTCHFSSHRTRGHIRRHGGRKLLENAYAHASQVRIHAYAQFLIVPVLYCTLRCFCFLKSLHKK